MTNLSRSNFLAIIAIIIFNSLDATISKFIAFNYPKYCFSSIRYAVCAIFLIPFIKKNNISKKWILLSSIFVYLIANNCYYKALSTGIYISVFNIFDSLIFFFSAIIGSFIINEPLRKGFWIGMLFSFTSVFILCFSNIENVYFLNFNLLLPFAFLLIGVFFYSINNVIVRRQSRVSNKYASLRCYKNIFGNIFWMSLFGFIFNAIFSIIFESNRVSQINSIGLLDIAIVLYFVFCSTLAYNFLLYFCARFCQIQDLAGYTIICPVLSSLIGSYVYEEHITMQTLTSGICALSAVFFVNFFDLSKRGAENEEIGRKILN